MRPPLPHPWTQTMTGDQIGVGRKKILYSLHTVITKG